MRFRTTIRGEGVELRGYVDDSVSLNALSVAMEPFGIVIASPAEDDYNPFAGTETYRISDLDGTDDEASWLTPGHVLDRQEAEWLRNRLIVKEP